MFNRSLAPVLAAVLAISNAVLLALLLYVGPGGLRPVDTEFKVDRLEARQIVVKDEDSGNAITLMAQSGGSYIFLNNLNRGSTPMASLYAQDDGAAIGVMGRLKQGANGDRNDWTAALAADSSGEAYAQMVDLKASEVKLVPWREVISRPHYVLSEIQ